MPRKPKGVVLDSGGMAAVNSVSPHRVNQKIDSYTQLCILNAPLDHAQHLGARVKLLGE